MGQRGSQMTSFVTWFRCNLGHRNHLRPKRDLFAWHGPYHFFEDKQPDFSLSSYKGGIISRVSSHLAFFSLNCSVSSDMIKQVFVTFLWEWWAFSVNSCPWSLVTQKKPSQKPPFSQHYFSLNVMINRCLRELFSVCCVTRDGDYICFRLQLLPVQF